MVGALLGEFFYQLRHPLLHRAEVKRLADDPRGGHNHLRRGDSKRLGRDFTHALRLFQAIRIAGVCNAAVAHGGARFAIRQVLLCHSNRRAAHQILRVNGGGIAQAVRRNQREVAFRFVFTNSAVNACRGKAFCRSNPTGDK